MNLYDANNNITTWYYDALGRVTGEVNFLDDSRNFEYDGAGRLRKKIDRLERITEYGYNTLDQATSETWKNGSTVERTISYAYNVAGQMTAAEWRRERLRECGLRSGSGRG